MDPRDLIDDLLEVAVIPSFSRIGFAVRRRLRGWTPTVTTDLAGRTALVTGATGGLGQANADLRNVLRALEWPPVASLSVRLPDRCDRTGRVVTRFRILGLSRGVDGGILSHGGTLSRPY